MLLTPKDAELFIKLHASLLRFVDRKLEVHAESTDPEQLLTPQQKYDITQAFLANDPQRLIEEFIRDNPNRFSADELQIVASWRHLVTGRFCVFRQLKKHMIFLSAGSDPIAYGVLAVTEPFEAILGPQLPRVVETVLLPFRDMIVYDGLLITHNVFLGGNIKRNLNEAYRESKAKHGVVTTLPVPAAGTLAAKSAAQTGTKKRTTGKKQSSRGADDVKRALAPIVEITDAFCREHLNDEYAQVCRKMAEKLSRKRPSPLLRGQTKTWACGILRAVGWVNFLDDRSSQPYMPLTKIDKILGVSQSTGQNKSKDIRRMLRIREFDVDWTLPSRMDDNPRAWLLDVDGFVVDARKMPREFQEAAFAHGLIPYIPADRPSSKGGRT